MPLLRGARSSVGSVNLAFSDVNNGTFSYTVERCQLSRKAITRQVFFDPPRPSAAKIRGSTPRRDPHAAPSSRFDPCSVPAHRLRGGEPRRPRCRDGGSLRPRQVHRAGHQRAGCARLRPRGGAGGHGAARRSAADRVALFVHGAGTPAEVAFDVPYKDYSWMAYLAQAGFDVFSMDMTGYGRSTRPAAMNDPCNLSKEQPGAVRARPDPGAVRAVPAGRRSRRWDRTGTTSARSSITFARCGGWSKGRDGRLVARRSAHRRLRGAQSAQGAPPGGAGSGLRAHRTAGRARTRCRAATAR